MLWIHPLFFPTVINPFERERTLWQMGYFSCSRPPTSIEATHPYRPGGHMCCTPPWRSAAKGHGDTPARCSLVSDTMPNMAKTRSLFKTSLRSQKKEINQQIAVWFLHYGKPRWIDLSPDGHRRVPLRQLCCEVVSVGSNLGLLCHVRKSFYGPFPASCAISIDLSSHLHSSVLPRSAAIERLAVISNVQYLRLEREEQIEWRGESASGLRLWRRPCSACHSLSNVKTAWREVRTKCDANRNCVYIHLLKEIRLESTFRWNLVRVNAFLWPLNLSRHIKARIPFHKSYKLMLWQHCAHRWFKVQLPNTKAIKKKSTLT